MEWRVPLADLNFDDEEEKAVSDVLHSRWLTMGAVTQEFEKEFAEAEGVKYAFAVSNATVALHLACLGLGIGPGDEVIAPSLTFVATTNAVLYTGADVRFADIIGLDELTISPEAIERQITHRTRAIMVMHYGGYPCRIEEIAAVARKHNLFLIEDAAHAPGASIQGRSLGTWSDAGCFSFFSNKNLSTGEGGMLVTDREDVAAKVRTLRSHGMTTLTWDRHQGHAYSYDVVDLGYNYRIDEIRSALGRVQLKKLAGSNARRGEITRHYWQEFSNSGLVLPFSQVEGSPSYHIFPIILPEGADRKYFIDCLREEGIQTSIHYPSIHGFSYYQKRYLGISLPVTEAAAAREVTLPLYPTMTDEAVELVVQSVRKTMAAMGKGSH
ncbi:MAG: DegT/DnrJ/EryC1/StrS family aminotransferase [Chloroflexi bacterium]|nr:DegT/DnrJ/EryC1/StrS family aminotransferase [Chloroflexota bacterium]